MPGTVEEINRHRLQELLRQDAQLVEVLPKSEYEDAHLPGAVSIPLPDLPEQAPSQLNRDRPVIVYCYDALCDMSPRAAWRLVDLGFARVYDYVASKVDWMGAGLPFEGNRAESSYLATLVDEKAPACLMDEPTRDVRGRLDEWEICPVVNDRGVVLGLVRAEALEVDGDREVSGVMEEAPQTSRPHLTAAELQPQLDKARQPWVMVTNLDGSLVGLARPEWIRAAADKKRS